MRTYEEDGIKTAHDGWALNKEGQIDVFLKYEIVNDKVVVKRKSFSITKFPRMEAYPEQYWSDTPSGIARKLASWARKYAKDQYPEILDTWNTKRMQAIVNCMSSQLQSICDRELFTKRVDKFNSEMNALMKKYNVHFYGMDSDGEPINDFYVADAEKPSEVSSIVLDMYSMIK